MQMDFSLSRVVFFCFSPIMGIIEKSLKGFRGAAREIREMVDRLGGPHVCYAIALRLEIEIGFHYAEMRLKSLTLSRGPELHA
jgi:hypothetical protein